jgi:hypothetical protein
MNPMVVRAREAYRALYWAYYDLSIFYSRPDRRLKIEDAIFPEEIIPRTLADAVNYAFKEGREAELAEVASERRFDLFVDIVQRFDKQPTSIGEQQHTTKMLQSGSVALDWHVAPRTQLGCAR